MNDQKLQDRFATPNSSKLAQILLDLRGVEAQQGLCNLQPNDMSLWPEGLGEVGESQDQRLLLDAGAQDVCNCRKSRCLKLYCQCFAARATCGPSCRCLSCENRPDNAAVREAAVNLILERNPNAFDSKYRPTSASFSSNFTAITSIAHKNGCRCRKSLCLKKYCECFQGGVPCSAICTCLSCQNTAPHTSVASGVQLSVPAEVGSKRLQAVEELGASSSAMVTSFTTSSFFAAAKDESATAASSSVSAATAAASACKPPLVPPSKRRRESQFVVPSMGAPGAAMQQDAAEVVAERKPADEAASSSPDSTSTSIMMSAPQAPMPSTPTLTRAQQQQLLEQLLYQELESQGLLSSPFASFVNLNCPGLLPRASTGPSDLLSLFAGQQLRSGAQIVPADGVAAKPSLFSSPAVGSAPVVAPGQEGQSLLTASPNSISIATALALLAARATGQLQVPSATTTAAGVAAVASQPIVTPCEKSASRVAEEGQSSGGLLAGFNGSTPVAVWRPPSTSGASGQDTTDDEASQATGPRWARTARSDQDKLSETAVSGDAHLKGEDCAPAKDLFGAAGECAQTPDTVFSAGTDRSSMSSDGARAAAERDRLLSEKLRAGDMAGLKENTSPNRLRGAAAREELRGPCLLR